jgi:hypothetical protein
MVGTHQLRTALKNEVSKKSKTVVDVVKGEKLEIGFRALFFINSGGSVKKEVDGITKGMVVALSLVKVGR